MENQDNLRSFYDKLKSNPDIIGIPNDFNVFQSTMNDDKKSRKFYDIIKEGGLVEGLPDDFESFSSILGHVEVRIDKNALQKQLDDFSQQHDAFLKEYDDTFNENALRRGRVLGGSTPVELPGGNLLLNLFSDNKERCEKNDEFIESNRDKYKDIRHRKGYLQNALDLAKLSEDNTEFDPKASGWKNFWDGATKSGLLKDFATFGMNEMVRTNDIVQVAEKKAQGKELNPEEESLLKTYGALEAIQKEKPIESIGYGIGRTAKEMIPFMAEFAATGGITSGLKAGLKGALKVGMDGAKNQFLRKLGVHAVESVPRSMLAQNMVGADYEQRRLNNYNVGSDGSVEGVDEPTSILGDYYRAAASNWTEFFSEDLGGLVKIGHTGIGAVDRAAEAIGKRFNKLKGTKFWKWGSTGLEKAGWHGVIGEYVEENVGNVMQAALTGDSGLFDSFNAEDQLVLAGSVLAMGGAMRGLQYGLSSAERGSHWVKQERGFSKVNKGLEVIGEKNANTVRSAVGGDESIEYAVKTICDISKELDDSQRRALLDYTISSFARKGRMSAMEKELSDKMGRFANQSGVVQIMADMDGNNFFVTGGSLDGDKKVYTVNDGEGNVSVKPAREMVDVLTTSKEEFINEYVLRSAVTDQQNNLSLDGVLSTEKEKEGGVRQFRPGEEVNFKGEIAKVQRLESDGTVIIEVGDPLDGGRIERISANELQEIGDMASQEGESGANPGDIHSNYQEATPQDETLDEKQIPLDKQGKPDYNTMIESDPGMFASEWEKRSTPEDAMKRLSVVSENVGKRIETLIEKNERLTDFNQIAINEDEIKKFREYKKKIDGVLSERYAPKEQGVESVIPEALSTKPEFSSDEEAVRWVIDESNDIDEVLGTYEAVKNLNNNVQNNVPRWQQELLGAKVKPDSFYKFGDRNKVDQSFRLAWLSKTGRGIDELARDLSEYGVEVSEQDIVDFMSTYPTGKMRKSNEELSLLGDRFSELASGISGMKVGRPDSPTGKLFIEKLSSSKNAEQLRDQMQSVKMAEDEALKSMAEQYESEKSDELPSGDESEIFDTKEIPNSEEQAEIEEAAAELRNEKEEYGDDGDIMYRNVDDVSIENTRFNDELQQQIEGKLPKDHVYRLGKPGAALRSAGIANIDIEMPSSRLVLKSSRDYKSDHPFNLSDVRDLPDAIQNPVAVFESETDPRRSVVLTELKSGNDNFLAVLDVVRDGRRNEINSIISLYPKNSSTRIGKWFDSRNQKDIGKDLLKWVDKEKALKWLSGHSSNVNATGLSSKRIANIINSFENPTVLEGEVSSEIDRISDELGVKVNKVKNRTNLPDGIRQRVKNGRFSGLYDTQTGEVYVVTDEITDVADAQATVLHEVLGHKSLWGLFGDKLPDFCQKVLASMDKAERAAWIKQSKGNEQLAAEEYVARFAEGYSDPTAWEKVKAIVKEFLQDMGIELKVSDNDLKYILWKAKNGLKQKDGLIDAVKKIKRDKEISDVLFRKVSPEIIEAEEFIRKHQGTVEAAREKFVDSAVSVKKLIDFMKKKGVDVRSFEDAYSEGLLSDSKSFHAMNRYRDKYQMPLNKAVAGFRNKGKSFQEIYHYLIAKHASERNRELREREMREWTEKKSREGMIEREKLEAERQRKEDELNQTTYAGLSDAEAAKIVSDFEKDCDVLEIENLWKRINDATGFALERQFKDGLISKELLDNLKGMYQYYVPLKGWEGSDGIDYSKSERFYRPTTVHKIVKAKGRRTMADNPLAYIEMAAESAITEGNRNYVRQCMYNMCVNHPDKNLYTVSRTYYVEREGEWIAQTEKPSQDLFDDGKVKMELVDKPHKDFIKDTDAQRYDINVFVNGEKNVITFSQGEQGLAIADAINGARMARAGKFSQSIGNLTRFLAAQNTSRNPEFILRNFERDFLYAVPSYAIKGGNSLKLMSNLPKAFKAIHTEFMHGEQKIDSELNRYMNEYLDYGGKTGFVHSLDIDSRKRRTQRDIKRIANKHKPSGWALATGHAAGATLDYLGDISENSIRLAVYITERQQGKGAKEAAIAAKEITVNFNRKGTLTPVLGQYFAFFNASVQGSIHNFLGLGIQWTNRFLVCNAILGAVQMIAAQLSRCFGDKDEFGVSNYDLISNFTRNNNIILPDILRLAKPLGLQSEEGRKYGFMTIPMSQSFRAISAAGIITDQVYRGRQSATDGTLEIIDNLLANMSPLSLETYNFSTGKPMMFLARALPTSMQPIVDIVANKDFTDRQIYLEPYSKNLEGMLPESSLGLKSTNSYVVDYTKGLNKLANGTMNINPEIQIDNDGKVSRNKFMGWLDQNPAVIEHVIEGFTGGAGKFVNNVIKTTKAAITGEELNNNNIPFVRTHRTMPYRQTHWEMFYEAREHVADVDFASSTHKKTGAYGTYVKILTNGNQLRDVVSYRVVEELVKGYRELMDQAATEERKEHWRKVMDRAVLNWAKGQKEIYDQSLLADDKKRDQNGN